VDIPDHPHPGAYGVFHTRYLVAHAGLVEERLAAVQEEWWENPTRIVNDYWWLFLLLLVLALTGWFTRGSWMPEPPPPTATATLVPTASPSPTLTPRPTTTSTAIPTATRVETLGTGDVQVTLLWDSTNDLDLWVTDPAGETIYYRHNQSASNGHLDVDANPACHELTTTPVENIFWPTGDAPQGTYTVLVNYYQKCQEVEETPFQVRLLVNGQTQLFDLVAHAQNDTVDVTTFVIGQ
jgi:hypothetical protein